MIRVYGLLLFCLYFQLSLWAQKKISGCSVPVQFSMGTANHLGEIRKALRDDYTFSLQLNSLDSLPESRPIRRYSVAVVIGVEQYDFMPQAPYAARDAGLISRYFKTILGVDKVIVHTDKEVAGFFFENLFNSVDGELTRVIEKGKTDLYIYYSGHGITSADGKEMYLIPVDCKLRHVDRHGYSLNTLFKELADLPTLSTTVFLDACFSGLGKFSQLGVPMNLTGEKGVRVKPLLVQPWLHNPDFRVFTSSSKNQPSLVLDEVRMGLFSYFLATGLCGKADSDDDGYLTAEELYKYMYSNIIENSRKIYQEQTPEFYGDGSSRIY